MSDARIIQRGVARVNTAAGVLDAYIGILNQTINGKHQWDGQNIKDFAGFEVGWDARNTHIILAITFKLSAASQALAIANGAFLAEYSEITISGADLPWINATGVGGYFTGHWCYHEGGAIDLSNVEPAGMNLSLRKFKDPTQNALQFAVPA